MSPISERALVDPTSEIGQNVTIWHESQIREHAVIGSGTTIGRCVYVGPGVNIGKNCKIQNNSLIFEPAELGDGVFIGPGTVFTNDLYPRAVNADYSIKSVLDWNPVGVKILSGASVGANVTCIAPITIGTWAMIAAGSVVTNDVRNFALVAGNPARFLSWVGRLGFPLTKESNEKFFCPQSGEKYKLRDENTLELI